MKIGYVTIVGRPNVGKSTLLNSILMRKIAITSNKVGTTRNIIEGIYNDDDSQIIFVDTPGISAKPVDKLSSVLNKKSYGTVDKVNLILFLVDASTGLGTGDKKILERLKNEETDVFLVLNKIDKIKKEDILKLITEYKDLFDFKEIIPISGLKENNLEELLNTIKLYLEDGEAVYNEEEVTNIKTTFYISEIVREKILNLTEKEVPHSVACIVEKFLEDDEKVIINVLIIVDRDSLKKIIIGKNGSMIKQIGILARKDLEEYFGKKVYLETFVKTIKDWREKESSLKELGLDELDS